MENGLTNGNSGDHAPRNGLGGSSDDGTFLFTSESVAEGHPGKKDLGFCCPCVYCAGKEFMRLEKPFLTVKTVIPFNIGIK